MTTLSEPVIKAMNLANRFLECGDSIAFEQLWSSTINMVNPYKYYDPTGARDQEDFLQITRIALLKALKTFDKTKGQSILSWIKMHMTQALTKELRVINKRGLGTKISLDTSIFLDEKNSTVEEMIYEQLIAQDSYQHMRISNSESDELLNEMLKEVGCRLYYNILISRFFGLIIAFPHMSRTSLSQLLGVTTSKISNYYFVVKGCITQVAKEYDNILYEKRIPCCEGSISSSQRSFDRPKSYIFDTETAKENLEQYFINHSLYE